MIMRTVCYLTTLLFFLSVPMYVSAQVFEIKSDFKEVKDSIYQYGKGDTLAITYDSVYLLNQTQIRYYQLLMNLKVAVRDDQSQIERIIKDLLQSMSGSLTKLESLNEKMKANADSTSAIGLRLAETTITNVQKTDLLLTSAKVQLDTASARLTRADAHLAKAEELIKQEKKKRCWRNIKWGLGGAIVGYVLKWLL
jgi:hypothetical protein